MGTDVRGALDYDGDIDYFRFTAREGQLYQIDVGPGTLDDPIVSLYGGHGSLLLGSNDDYGDTLASRLFWEAPSFAYRYVAVEGYGTGTYTLTVSTVDDHDHGNDFDTATRIAIGDAVVIELEDPVDRDVLVFRARPGTEYVFRLSFQGYGIRSYPAVIAMDIHDAGGRVLARLGDYDFSLMGSRNKIRWQAATGGDYYIVLGNGRCIRRFRTHRNREVSNGNR